MATATQLEKRPTPIAGQPQWAGRLQALWGRTQLLWARMAPGQRRGVIVTAVLLGALTAGLAWYGLRTDWRTLYTGLDPDDARQMGQALTQAQVSYDLSPDGSIIRVPAAQLDKARLAASARGGLKTGRLGFELFDKPNWVGSEFDEQVNYQRALEGELEHTIGTLADIESARVHLVMPHDSLFRQNQRPAKAAVVLKLRHGSLADGEPDAIRNLVASAVDGLTPDHVVLVDADGHLPLGPKTPEALEASTEQALEDKIVAELEPVTGPGNVRASVTLEYNAAQTDVTQQTYDPTQTVTLTMQRSEQTAGSQPVAAGVPGAASNAPNTQALPVYPKQTTGPESAKTESGTYAASNTVKHTTQEPGQVRRMTAAIVVNDRMLAAATKAKAAVWQARPADELAHLTALAQAAVGFDAARGDTLTVEDLSFAANRPEPPVPMAEQALSVLGSSPELVKYAALLVGVLAVLLFGVRPALRSARTLAEQPAAVTPELAAGAAQAAAAALGSPGSPEVEAERLRSQAIFDQVAEHLKREPTQSSRLLQSWIHSD
ncbi:MAG TPA: flagellar basal-body MS-ring/collar protein FliF [Terracidiphilus sp.]|jgi:flagellar M-ring protein FliF|nr:flagellar basal-body MS-ring/collar protein FliF [Terracidiphilus sp.]